MQRQMRRWLRKGVSFRQQLVFGQEVGSAQSSAPRRPAATYAVVEQAPVHEEAAGDWEAGEDAAAVTSPNGPGEWANEKEGAVGETDEKLASTRKTFVNALLCFFGSGCLGLPYAAERVGLIAGTVLLWAIALISLHCMLLLVDCREHLQAQGEPEGKELEEIQTGSPHLSPQRPQDVEGEALKQNAGCEGSQLLLQHQRGLRVRTYGDIGFHAFGRAGNLVVDFCIILTQTGFGTAYLIFISFNLHDMWNDISETTFLWLCVPVLAALCWLPSLKYLAPFSLLAEAALLVALCAIFFVDIEEIDEYEQEAVAEGIDGLAALERNVSVAFMSGVPFFFGVAVYCYEGVGMVLPVLNSMAEPARFKRVWSSALITVTTVYSLFAIAGVVAFGDSVSDIITKNLPAGSTITALVKLGLCLGLYFTYPLMLFPVFELWEVQVQRTCGNPPRCSPAATHHLFRLCYVLLTAVLAAAIPNFGVFISLVGASASAALAFVLPAAFHLKLRWSHLSTLARLRDMLYILIGVLGGIVGTLFALKDAADAMFPPLDAPPPAANLTLAVTAVIAASAPNGSLAAQAAAAAAAVSDRSSAHANAAGLYRPGPK